MESLERKNIGIPSHIPKLPIIWVIGGPGSGKGTLCELLSNNYNFHHISVGNLLRNEVKSGSKLKAEIEEHMKQGKLVSADLVLHLIEKDMLTHTNHRGYLIDGFPREVDQGLQFEETIRPADCVLFLEASEMTMKKRLKHRSKSSNRIDDNEESIQKRIKLFRKVQKKILKTFETKIRKISAEESIETVYKAAVTVLNDFLAEGKVFTTGSYHCA